MSDTCFSCSAPITWVVTPAGRRMPVEAAPLTGSRMAEMPRGAVVVLVDERRQGDAYPLAEALELLDDARHTIHISHFASCPFASAHRRRPAR